MFCKHVWEKISEQVLPSAVEQIGSSAGSRNIPAWCFEKKFVLILQRKKCGRLNKTEITNP
jgi:hypothetical protein